jgi:hypothetical protein
MSEISYQPDGNGSGKLTGDFVILVTGHTSSDIIDVTPAISNQATNEDRAGGDLLAVVVVDRSHVGQDLTAVEPNPVESGMGEVVSAVSLVHLAGLDLPRCVYTHVLFHESFCVKKFCAPDSLAIWGS